MLHIEIFTIPDISPNGMVVYIKPKTSVVITPSIVEEIRNIQDCLANRYINQDCEQYYYVIWYLDKRQKNICQGLDFAYILDCLKNSNDGRLEHYIDRIFNVIFLNYVGLGFPVINCSISTSSLTGLSREFFFMNKIVFIRNKELSELTPVNIYQEMSGLLFPENIYENNKFYYYNSIQAPKMKDIIEAFDYKIPDAEEINSLKLLFDHYKEETKSNIYRIASKNIKILERMAVKY